MTHERPDLRSLLETYKKLSLSAWPPMRFAARHVTPNGHSLGVWDEGLATQEDALKCFDGWTRNDDGVLRPRPVAPNEAVIYRKGVCMAERGLSLLSVSEFCERMRALTAPDMGEFPDLASLLQSARAFITPEIARRMWMHGGISTPSVRTSRNLQASLHFGAGFLSGMQVHLALKFTLVIRHGYYAKPHDYEVVSAALQTAGFTNDETLLDSFNRALNRGALQFRFGESWSLMAGERQGESITTYTDRPPAPDGWTWT